MKAHELMAKYGFEGLGCGDHSCMLGGPRGMGTNGGCRCIPVPLHRMTESEARDLRMFVRRMAHVLRAVAAERE